MWLWRKIQELPRSFSLNIAIAFIENNEGQILITRRASNTVYGGYWELPGGKVENQESPEQAIQREIFEELNLNVLEMQWIANFKDDILFHIFRITKFSGDLNLKAGQSDYQWVFQQALKDFEFPSRNQHFFKLWQCSITP